MKLKKIVAPLILLSFSVMANANESRIFIDKFTGNKITANKISEKFITKTCIDKKMSSLKPNNAQFTIITSNKSPLLSQDSYNPVCCDNCFCYTSDDIPDETTIITSADHVSEGNKEIPSFFITNDTDILKFLSVNTFTNTLDLSYSQDLVKLPLGDKQIADEDIDKYKKYGLEALKLTKDKKHNQAIIHLLPSLILVKKYGMNILDLVVRETESTLNNTDGLYNEHEYFMMKMFFTEKAVQTIAGLLATLLLDIYEGLDVDELVSSSILEKDDADEIIDFLKNKIGIRTESLSQEL